VTIDAVPKEQANHLGALRLAFLAAAKPAGDAKPKAAAKPAPKATTGEARPAAAAPRT